MNTKYDEVKMIIGVWGMRTGRMAGGWQKVYLLLENIQFEMQWEIQMDRKSSPESFALCPYGLVASSHSLSL